MPATMTERSKELRKQRAAVIEEMNDLTKDNGAWRTAEPDSEAAKEAAKRFKALDGQQQSLEEQVAAVERSTKLDAEMREVIPPPAAQIDPPENRRAAATPENATKRTQERLNSPEYRSAFIDFCRYGERSMPTESRRVLNDVETELRTYTGLQTPTSGDGAGYTVPIAFQKELEIAMKAYGRMRENCRILTTSGGNTLDWPAMDDTTNQGEFVGENNAVSQLNPTFSQIQFNSYLASSKQVLVSVQLLQDSAFDVEALLRDAFAIRLGRILNSKYTNGTGTAEPQGLVYAIKNDSVPNTVKATGSNSNDGISGNTEANSVGSDDLDNLISAVDPAYRTGAKFMMHWATIDFLRKVKDKYGRPLWVSNLAVGEPDRIYGYAYDWNSDMDQIGANKYPILFGDFSKHVIRDVSGISVVRYEELYMPNHQKGFQAFLRTDSRRLQQKAFSLLWNPLS